MRIQAHTHTVLGAWCMMGWWWNHNHLETHQWKLSLLLWGLGGLEDESLYARDLSWDRDWLVSVCHFLAPGLVLRASWSIRGLAHLFPWQLPWLHVPHTTREGEDKLGDTEQRWSRDRDKRCNALYDVKITYCAHYYKFTPWRGQEDETQLKRLSDYFLSPVRNI